MLLALAIAAALQVPAASPPAATHADAYLDPGAAEMVAGARARNVSANERIRAYQMTARQRISVGLRALRRDRMLYTRELVSRIDWRRDEGVRAEVMGAREASEVAIDGVRPVMGDEVFSSAIDLGFDPSSEWLLRFPGENDEDQEAEEPQNEDAAGDQSNDRVAPVHPLAEGSEASYRFRSGETTTIRLADGRTIRLRELQVLPRRSVPTLVRGSLWLDADSYAAVRGVFSLAAPMRFTFDVSRDMLSFGVNERGALLELGSATLDYLTVEYSLWDGEWWLPSLVSLEGKTAVGRFTVPLVFEQRHEDYRVYADVDSVPEPEPIDTTRFEIVRRGCGNEDDEAADSTTMEPPAAEPECSTNLVLVPRDTAVLVSGEAFPRPLSTRGRLMTESELARTLDLIRSSSWRSMLFQSPRFEWKPLDGSLAHYNRVEGLTLGTSATVELQPLSLRGAAWIALADRSPGLAADLVRSRPGGSEALGAYRRVQAFTPDDRPFSLGSSVSAFAFGTDTGDYYRTTGLAFTSEQAPTIGSRLGTRIYMERQSALTKNTDASVPGWFDDRSFRPNPAADEADQFGIDVRARFEQGLNANALRGGGQARLRAERGTFSFAQPSLSAFTTFPLPGSLRAGLEAEAGTSFGAVPVQSLWYLGGRSTVRGYRPEDRVAGDTFWRGRAEVGSDLPAFRVVLFSDAGWAGSEADFTTDPAMISAGVGVSVLDGLVRADLARTLRGPGRWGLQLSLDAIF